MEKPYFSVITPTYNRGYIIEDMIKSLISQNFKDWELIIIDDGSTDNTEEIIKKYIKSSRSNKIKYYKLKTNKGVNIARNTGIKFARGKWIIFLDSDDKLVKDGLDTIFSLTKEIKETPLIFTSCITTRNRYTSNRPEFSGYLSYSDYLCEKINGEYLTTVENKIFNEFRFDEDIIGGERILWNRIAKKFGKVYISSRITRIYNEDLTDRLSIKRKNLKRLSSVFKKDLKEFGKEYIRYCPLLFFKKFTKYIIYTLMARYVG